MQKQLSLFPEPEVTYSSLTPENKSKLEEIMLKACEHSLMFGECRGGLEPEGRLNRMIKYFGGEVPSVSPYLITYDKKTIGCAYVWDGWLAVEGEYVDPDVELAFIDPEYKEHVPSIKRKLYHLLEEVRENQGW